MLLTINGGLMNNKSMEKLKVLKELGFSNEQIESVVSIDLSLEENHGVYVTARFIFYLSKDRYDKVLEILSPKCRPCPFCKSKMIEIKTTIGGFIGYCYNCRVNGPTGRSEKEAINIWNGELTS